MGKKHTPPETRQPLRHQDHPRPRTRREFLAQGFLSGVGTVVGPSLLGMLAGARSARAALAPDIQSLLQSCNITSGAGKIPFICFDLAGGGNIAGSNVLVGGPNGQLDFLSVAGYSKLGLPGGMVPNPSASGNFIDSSLGLRFHSDSAHLRGIKARAKASALAGTNGAVIPALSQNDTDVNPHNPIYGIYQYGARGGLLNLIGSASSVSGGNSMAPPSMVIAAAQPSVVASESDTTGLVSTGQLNQLLPNANEEAAWMVAERMRANVARTPWPFAHLRDFGGETPQITISIGAATYDRVEDLPSLLRRADEYLYAAKDRGRNRVLQCA